MFKKVLLTVVVLSLLGTILSGCAGGSKSKVPADYKWAAYNSAGDAPFLPKDIYRQELFVPGIVAGDPECGWMEFTDRTDVGAVILKGEYGKCYEVKVPQSATRVCAARLTADPREAGDKIYCNGDKILYDKADLTEGAAFMYVCRRTEEYLIICTDTTDPIYIGERTILAKEDTKDTWYVPSEVGSIGWDCTWGDFTWTSEDVINNLYEPIREKYPDYITRTVIGKDQSGQYDMYGYIYAPEHYETTIFLTGGMHADEESAYFALAKMMQMIADATSEDQQLYTLRHKVRFVVVPIINVWGVSQSHTGKGIAHSQIRKNSTGTDLNRDFGELTQQESKNVIAFFEQYADEVRVAMDFHNADRNDLSLWFNFINYSENSVVNYKTTNHIYHRYMELGYAHEITDMTHLPGSYTKSDKYIEGRLWNSYGVPTITVEYVTDGLLPQNYSSEAMTAAVETFINFVIQNALFFIENK